jgi:hypothetical protein
LEKLGFFGKELLLNATEPNPLLAMSKSANITTGDTTLEAINGCLELRNYQ